MVLSSQKILHGCLLTEHDPARTDSFVSDTGGLTRTSRHAVRSSGWFLLANLGSPNPIRGSLVANATELF